MGLWELCHLLSEQGSQIGSPQMESSWQIILFGPHSVWKIGTFHIKIHLFSFLKKKSDIWQSSIAIFLHGKNWLDRAMAVLLRWECHLLPPSLLPTALHSAPFRLCGSPAPGFRGATGYHLHHLSLSPRYSLSSRSFLYFMFGVYGCVPFFFFFLPSLSRWIFSFAFCYLNFLELFLFVTPFII